MSQLDPSLAWSAALSIILVYAIWRLSKIGSRDPLLPPGPQTIPILGNLTIFPTKDAHLKFTEWSREYDGLYSLKVAHQTVIVVSAVEAVHDILEKNGAATVTRPKLECFRRITEPSGWISYTQYGPQFRRMRKAAAELVKPSTRLQHRPIRSAETSQLLFEVQEHPEDLYYHIQRSTASLIFSLVGGDRMPRAKTPLFTRFFHSWDLISEVLEPGNAPPVDVIPILNYIPDVFVGNWKARCGTAERVTKEVMNNLADAAERRLKEDRPTGCYLETMIQKAQEWDLNDDEIRSVGTGLVVGGTTTTAAFVQTAILLATAHPEAQRRVQEEFDRVIGLDRTPTLDDLPNLPQFNAFIREVHRFRPVAPLGVPHSAKEDVFYQGQLIPKGCTIYQNVWGTLHDPDLYDDPDTFDPERFIRSPYGTKPGVEDTISTEILKRLETVPFGVGRRRCVGMPMAIDSTSLLTANLLWAFDFCQFINDNGERIEPNLWAFRSGLTNEALPFKCKIKTRSQRQAELIKENYIQSTTAFEQYERELSKEDREYVEGVRAKF